MSLEAAGIVGSRRVEVLGLKVFDVYRAFEHFDHLECMCEDIFEFPTGLADMGCISRFKLQHI